MAETLTESYCERCGTRYEFKAPTRLNPLRRTRGLIGGLKNYLTSQDALGDAIGDAIRSEEESLAAAQLEAFHETFNFCISCRQYTCLNCWNDAEGRCRTCAPIAGTDDLAERLAASLAGAAPAVPPPSPTPDIGTAAPLTADAGAPTFGADSWPTSDLPEPVAASTQPWPLEEPTWPTLEAAPQTEPIFGTEPEPEPVVAAVESETVVAAEPASEPELEPEPEPVVAAEPTPELVAAELNAWGDQMVASDTADTTDERPPLRVVSWDDDLPYAVAEPEQTVPAFHAQPEEGTAQEPQAAPVVAEVEPEPEPVEAEAEPVEAEPEPAPVVAEVEPQPEPEPQLAPRIAPISETILRLPPRHAQPHTPMQPVEPAVAAAQESPEVAARRAQLDLLGLGDPGEGPVTPERPAVLPYRSRGAASVAPPAAGGFWEASAREVAGAIGGQIGVQSCDQCGLSLSANARFCRRCGARQAQSA